MKKFIAFWLFCSLITFGMTKYYVLEKWCYHGIICEHGTNAESYIFSGILALFGPIALVSTGIQISVLSLPKDFNHSQFGFALSENMMWPRHHNHNISELTTPKVKSAYGVESLKN